MKRRMCQQIAAAVATVGMLISPTAFAGQSIRPSSDVALGPGGVLAGQVVDEQGAAQAGVPVVIQQGQQPVVRTATNDQGQFYAQGLRGGQHQIVTPGGQVAYRFWAANTAPPAAQNTAVVVASSDVARGQWCCGPGGAWLGWVRAHPYITAGVIGAAIAIPLAVADDDWQPSS
jgi:hypothetical protein